MRGLPAGQVRDIRRLDTRRVASLLIRPSVPTEPQQRRRCAVLVERGLDHGPVAAALLARLAEMPPLAGLHVVWSAPLRLQPMAFADATIVAVEVAPEWWLEILDEQTRAAVVELRRLADVLRSAGVAATTEMVSSTVGSALRAFGRHWPADVVLVARRPRVFPWLPARRRRIGVEYLFVDGE